MNFKLKATMTDLLFYGKNNEINNKIFICYFALYRYQSQNFLWLK